MSATPAQILTGVRLAVGVGALVAPGLTGRLFGFAPVQGTQTAYFARLFGIRDVVLALGTSATTGPSRKRWWQLGVLADTTDVVSAYLGRKDGSLPTTTAILAGGTAALAAGLGAAAMAADEG